MPESPSRRDAPFPISEENLKRYETKGYFTVDHSSRSQPLTPEGSSSEFLGAVSRVIDKAMVNVSRNLIYNPEKIRVIPMTVRGRNREQDRATIVEALRNSGAGFTPIETLDRALLAFVLPINQHRS